MSKTPNAESDDGGAAFTCSTLLMCLYLPGLSKKKPEQSGTSRQPTADQDPPNAVVQEPPRVPSRAASSLHSASTIVFDFMVQHDERDGGGARAVHGYCPSPCFDLPAEMIRAGERCTVFDSGTPVTPTFVFGDYQGDALKKVASSSCLPSGVSAGREARSPHLVRFLSSSASGLP